MSYTAPLEPIRGNRGIVFTLAKIDPVTGTPGAALSFDGDLKAVEPTAEEKDGADLTFRESQTGEFQDFGLKLTAIATLEPGSLWRLFWDNPAAEFDVVWAPHGNALASAAKPHVKGRLKVNGKPFGFGTQEATRDKTRGSFDIELEFTQGPTLYAGA